MAAGYYAALPFPFPSPLRVADAVTKDEVRRCDGCAETGREGRADTGRGGCGNGSALINGEAAGRGSEEGQKEPVSSDGG